MRPAGVPKYAQIAAQIRELIARGELAVGDRAPSENELAADHRVSRYTASRALDMLAAERLIERVPGTGSIVIAMPAQPAELQVAPGTQIRARMPTLAEIAGGVPAGEPVLVVTRFGQPDESHPAGHVVIVTVPLQHDDVRVSVP